jgi:phosphinothricin acetyltransferase
MIIRDAVESDLAAIVAVYNASIPDRRATADLDPVSLDSRMSWFQNHNPQHRPIWVVEIAGGEVVGWLSFQSFYGRPAYQATAELSIYIAPAYRHQGLGQQLLSQAINQCPRLGLTTLLGFVFAHNLDSLKLFQKFRFQQWGYLPRVAVLDGVDHDLVIVGRRVEQGMNQNYS